LYLLAESADFVEIQARILESAAGRNLSKSGQSARKQTVTILFYLFAALMLQAPAHASGKWTRYRAEEYEIWSDASRRDVQQLAAALRSIRTFFSNARGPITPGALPSKVRVVMFGNYADFNEVKPRRNGAGFAETGGDHNEIVLANGTNLQRVARHEYTHLLTRRMFAYLPAWLEEGLAEFYSTAEARVVNNETVLGWGAPVPAHRELLNRTRWLTARELAPEDEDQVFYAEAWALTHYLATRYPRELDLYLSTVAAQGEPAFRKAFGRTLDQVIDDAKNYVAQATFSVRTERRAGGEPAALLESESGVEFEATEIHADLLWRAGKPDAAEKLYEKLANSQQPAQAAVARAFLALHREKPDLAKQEFEAAIAAGATDSSVLLQYAVLLRDLKAPPAQVDQALAKAAEAGSAEAAFLAGLRASDTANWARAVEWFSAAAQNEPRKFTIWHALALAQFRAGQETAAKLSAERARDCATSETEREMALALLSPDREKLAAQARREPWKVNTPSAWFNKEGDSRLEGTLERVDCDGARARLFIAAQGRSEGFLVTDPGKVVWRNSPGGNFELSCGVQKPRTVVVEYEQSTREVRALEFK
jgi:hypothetical protein